MTGRLGFTACALVLLAATPVFAEPAVTGTVLRVDLPSTLVLMDGRTIPLKGDTVVTVNGVPVTELYPGELVVIQQDGDSGDYPAAMTRPARRVSR